MIHIGRAQAYCANGNMTGRTVGSSYTLTYDVENRLTGVSGGASATVGNSVAATYDGDGNRVKGVAGGVTTYYVGNYYAYVGGAVKKYYYHAGKRVAMYDGATLNWLLGEHLGSTTITANSSGTRTGEIRYKAYGASRYTSGTTPTTYHFTGQREESTIGLYYYGARWYDPALGRFVQADSLIPQPEYPQDLNRYTYGRNNPLFYTDPTGHFWHIVAGALGGAAFSYGSQVVGNIIQGGLNVQAFTEINWGSVAGGAVAGAVGAATMGIGTAIMGTSLGATVATQAVSGVVEGQISRAVENVVNGNEWYEGLGNVGNMASDAAFSAFTAAVSWKPKASANLGLADGTGGAKASGAHTVYTVKNDAGEVIYVGRSSNLAARQSAHRGTLGRENWVLNPEVKGLSYKEARYHEQRLISKYGGVDALENKINGVAPAKWGALCKEFE